MAITNESKEKLKNRLAKAMGHLNAVHRMVDEKKYCIDVLHQMKAVQSALDKISEEILKQHLETCVVEAVRNQDSSRVIDELIQIFRKAPELNLEDVRSRVSPTPEPAPSSGNGKHCCH
ncbi:MAG TPA: metal-sensitive transcriptional regulator [Coleofasciculaceae cyanobacterium]|jgi:DNA-binding FrmR family transcriptional regulator